MDFLYLFPKQTAFGRILPKSKIYEHTAPTTNLKDRFVREVEKIIWSYKLSPETINLPATNHVQEIQVFTIVLKTGLLDEEILLLIDKAIPSPIFYQLNFENKTRYVAAYKRQNEADKSKWVVSCYFETDWISHDSKQMALPVTLSLGALYQRMIQTLLPLTPRQNEPIEELIDRAMQIKTYERELSKVETKIKNEKQFKRKVEINSELRKIKQKIEDLKSLTTENTEVHGRETGG